MRHPSQDLQVELEELLERERHEAAAAAPAGAHATPRSRERLIPVKEAAERRGVSRAMVYQWVEEGQLTKHKVGSRTFVDEVELEALMFEQNHAPPNVTRAPSSPVTVRDSVPHVARGLHVRDNAQRKRLEELIEELVEEVRGVRLLALTMMGAARPIGGARS
jgi:excisionase family DNA binding protein